MVKVVATSKGYDNIAVREVGEVFDWPGEKIPGWTRLAAFGGKGDHDGNGVTGGSVATATGEVVQIVVPADWQMLKAGDRKALAKQISGQNVANAAEADKIIGEYVALQTPEPFAAAPPPEVVAEAKVVANEQPDWVAPSGDAAVGAITSDQQPVQADD